VWTADDRAADAARERAAQTRALEDQADALERIARAANLWWVLTWIWIVLSVLIFVLWLSRWA
jgi:hypothetical protein